jgi:hypothetical protein
MEFHREHRGLRRYCIEITLTKVWLLVIFPIGIPFHAWHLLPFASRRQVKSTS